MLYPTGLFIFHRDLRLTDNTGLLNACSKCKKVYCCFIFTPEQVGKQNIYKSKNAIQFMIESLEELTEEIHKRGGELIMMYGKTLSSVKHIIEKIEINAVFFNKDYSPYAVKRDTELQQLCEKMEVDCIIDSDYYLYEPGSVKTTTNQTYKKYTPFYEAVMRLPNPPDPSNKKCTHFATIGSGTHISNRISIVDAIQKFAPIPNDSILVHGGRLSALRQLKKAATHQKEYEEKRDILTYDTTFLSAYIKFGCISIREVYHIFTKAYGHKSGIIRELIWREFFAHVLYAFPEVVGKSYQPRYRGIAWRKSTMDFDKWKKGMTGFPIVDAGMRQLNETGYMHNRVRMMVASFLVKVLLLDWRWGEQYFSQKLTDVDIASNNGNWQGISGTGVDMKPYFRDMNPWIQSSKFDNEAEYIYKWVPELKDVPSRAIHKWDIEYMNYKHIQYPKPMTNYEEQKEKMLHMYKNA